MELLEFERRLDATITRKTLDIQDAASKPGKVVKINKHTIRTLRIFLSNLAANQNPDTLGDLDIEADRTPSWTFKIEGRLLDVQSY